MAPLNSGRRLRPDEARRFAPDLDGPGLQVYEESDGRLTIQDDSQFMRFVVKKILEKNGFRITMLDDRTLRAELVQPRSESRGGRRP